MMDPAQIQMMQQLGIASANMGIPGFLGQSSGSMPMLAATANSYTSPIAGNARPDVSPLAPMGLQNYGILGTVASLAGNAYMSNMFAKEGVMSMGNAGSFMQAQQANQYMQMQQQVAQAVAPQDADAFYSTIKGVAALTGQPFNRQQRRAARSLANTVAEFGPNIAMFRPDILDALAGDAGSVQAMASQMMEANRYRIDPYTGQMGYGALANQDLLGSLFDQMYSKDNMAQMNGLRAGEAGQLFKELSNRGLMASGGDIRTRTISALESAQRSGELTGIAAEAGVNVDNLQDLSFDELEKLRGTGGLQKIMTKADASNIKQQLQGYSESVSAMREIFGENGNPNAPIPQLIGALEALTSGQMQKFDANKLNVMVRDMQAMSQMSGKSIDQLLAMNQANTGALSAMGLGPHASVFAPTATNIGAAHGMAFSEVAGATGFGALSREGAEQAAGNLFARGMASESANLYQTLGRISSAGGFDENTDAGRRLKAIHDAAVNQETTYVDPVTGETKTVPMREAEIRGLISAGGAAGVGLEDFNLMLGDRTSNLRMAAEDERYQTIAQTLQPVEYMRKERRDAANRIATTAALRDVDQNKRDDVAMGLVTSAQSAFNELSTQDKQDRTIRQRTMAEAIKQDALNEGITISDEEALTMAENMYGSFENTAVNKFGFESRTAADQLFGSAVVENRNNRTRQASARSNLNRAMSELGPKGTTTQRLFSAIQKAGERGSEADLNTFLIDMFGVENLAAKDKLVPELQAIANEQAEIEKLAMQLEDPNLSATEKSNLSREIEDRTKKLQQRNIEARAQAAELGMSSGEGTFGLDDVSDARNAARNITQLTRMDQIRQLSQTRDVTDQEKEQLKSTTITAEDLLAIAETRRGTQLENIDKLDSVDQQGVGITEDMKKEYSRRISEGMDPDVALNRLKEDLRSKVGSSADIASKLAYDFGSSLTEIGQLSAEDQEAAIKARRAQAVDVPTAEAVNERIGYLAQFFSENQQEVEAPEIARLAQDQLLAETQLRAMGELGADESLLDYDSIANSSALPAELKKELMNASVEERSDIAGKYLSSYKQQNFYGTPEQLEQRRQESIAFLGTAEGQRAMDEIGNNLDDMLAVRKDFVLDPKAAENLGADKAEAALTKGRNAELKLQELANNFGFNGSVEAMLATGFMGMDAEGAKAVEDSFNALSAEQKENIKQRLEDAGIEVDGDLSLSDYTLSLQQEADTAFNDLSSSISDLTGGATADAAAESLDVSLSQYNTLQELAGIEGTEGEELSDSRKKLRDDTRQKLRASGMSEEAIDEKLSIVKENKAKAKEVAEEFRRQDITSADVQLAELFGIDTTSATGEFEDFKSMLAESGGGAAGERNQRMLAGVLSAVSGIEGLEGKDAITKLDTLTDEYAQASSQADKQAIAEKYGLDFSELDTMMRQSEFMKLKDVDVSNLSDSEKMDLTSKSLKDSMGKDIEAEVAAERERQLTLTGTVNITGVVQGEGTFEDVTGNTVR